MNDKYVVHWNYKAEPDRKGYGSPLSRNNAECAAEIGNYRLPELNHYVVKAQENNIIQFKGR